MPKKSYDDATVGKLCLQYEEEKRLAKIEGRLEGVLLCLIVIGTAMAVCGVFFP